MVSLDVKRQVYLLTWWLNRTTPPPTLHKQQGKNSDTSPSWKQRHSSSFKAESWLLTHWRWQRRWLQKGEATAGWTAWTPAPRSHDASVHTAATSATDKSPRSWFSCWSAWRGIGLEVTSQWRQKESHAKIWNRTTASILKQDPNAKRFCVSVSQ